MLDYPLDIKGGFFMQALRKYQRYVVFFIAIIIVISFVFAESFSLTTAPTIQDTVAFKDISDREVSQSSLSALVRFLGSDVEDALLSEDGAGANFLNDGVIKKDFLQQGLCQLIAASFLETMKGDFEVRKLRQKNYKPYVHPYNKNLSARNAWAFFAPAIPSLLDEMNKDVTNEEFFNLQVALYLNEKNFPEPYLRQVLNHQQSNESNSFKDSLLLNQKLSLFGYTSLEDWFGPNFLTLAAKYIINSSEIAKQRGILVSDDEALAELLYLNEMHYRRLVNSKNSKFNIRSSQELFMKQLNFLGLDKGGAVDIWKKVIAFRKLKENISDSLFLDHLTIDNFKDWSNKEVLIELYNIPSSLVFNNANQLKYFEVYLSLITNSYSPTLILPKEFKSIDEIKELYPSIVYKKYDLNVASIDVSSLLMKSSLKEVWNWESDKNNWAKLLVKFPILGTDLNLTRQERLNILENLPSNTRVLVDNFARQEIVKLHPEWIDESLDRATFNKITIALKEKGDSFSKLGLKQNALLNQLLTTYPLSEEEKQSGTGIKAKEALMAYSEDFQTFYRIEVLRKDDNLTLLTFNEALKDGSLKKFSGDINVDVDLIKDLIVADAAENGYPWLEASGISKDEFAAKFRFFKQLREVQNQVKENNYSLVSNLGNEEAESLTTKANSTSFEEQFKIERKESLLVRKHEDPGTFDKVLSISLNEFSSVMIEPQKDPFFFKVIAFKEGNNKSHELMQKVQQELAKAATLEVLKQDLDYMIIKNAISLQNVTQ
jgi:hypothetical protein